MLNTEIMAGTGPDVLLLDGISEDTYIERGMLENLSGVLKDEDILPNIKDALQKRMEAFIPCLSSSAFR